MIGYERVYDNNIHSTNKYVVIHLRGLEVIIVCTYINVHVYDRKTQLYFIACQVLCNEN